MIKPNTLRNRLSLTVAGTALAGAALTACATKPPATYSDEYPGWVNGTDAVCAVTLDSELNSLSAVNKVASKLDSEYEGKRILVSGQADHIGQVINISAVNSNGIQQPGDVAVLGGLNQAACENPELNGTYASVPHIEAPGNN